MALPLRYSISLYKVGVRGIFGTAFGYPSMTNRLLAVNSDYFRRHYATPRLSPVEITEIISKNETTTELRQHSIQYFDSNQLAANSPIEDAKAEARCLLTSGTLFGVFDGHGGPTCSQIIAKRLLAYIAAALLPQEMMPIFLQMEISEYMSEEISFLERYSDDLSLRQDLEVLYAKSFHKFIVAMSAERDIGEENVTMAIKHAFTYLDADIANEVKSTSKETANHNLLLKIALSGSCASVAHIDGEDLHVASCGDCRVVLGTRVQDEAGSRWEAKLLSHDHNTGNEKEIARLLKEHPGEELENIIMNDRLLGMLAPLRAFGDIRFKWDKETLEKFISPYMTHSPVISKSITPPYLTAAPEVNYHKLGPNDGFLIMATDGLWDMMTAEDAVRYVGQHKSGKKVIRPYSVPENQEVTLGEIRDILMKRIETMKVKPIDNNAATHLIRYALGGTPEGLDINRLSGFLTLSGQTSRTYRDDITVTVIHFDRDYLLSRQVTA